MSLGLRTRRELDSRRPAEPPPEPSWVWCAVILAVSAAIFLLVYFDKFKGTA